MALGRIGDGSDEGHVSDESTEMQRNYNSDVGVPASRRLGDEGDVSDGGGKLVTVKWR
jgi:hypothetical protein